MSTCVIFPTSFFFFQHLPFTASQKRCFSLHPVGYASVLKLLAQKGRWSLEALLPQPPPPPRSFPNPHGASTRVQIRPSCGRGGLRGLCARSICRCLLGAGTGQVSVCHATQMHTSSTATPLFRERAASTNDVPTLPVTPPSSITNCTLPLLHPPSTPLAWRTCRRRPCYYKIRWVCVPTLSDVYVILYPAPRTRIISACLAQLP